MTARWTLLQSLIEDLKTIGPEELDEALAELGVDVESAMARLRPIMEHAAGAAGELPPAASVAPVSDGTGCDHPYRAPLAPTYAHEAASSLSVAPNERGLVAPFPSRVVEAPSERFARESWATRERMSEARR